MKLSDGTMLNVRDVYYACLAEAAAMHLISADEVAGMRYHPAKHLARAATKEITGASYAALGRALHLNHATIMGSCDTASASDCAVLVERVRQRLDTAKAQAQRERRQNERIAELESRVAHLERVMQGRSAA